MSQTNLPWIKAGLAYTGTKEIKGTQHSPQIMKWLISLGAWWRDDETPWCGVFVGAVLKDVGIAPAKAFYRAKAWLDWGTPLKDPAVGCVVVFERDGGGHVGFVVGRSGGGQLLVLGGNQGDEVNVRAFNQARAIGYRWPSGVPAPAATALPILAGIKLSESEA